MPEIFIVFGILFLAAPIARAIAKSIERSPSAGWTGRNDEAENLKKALQAAEQRLSDSETRLAALEERVDFYERLLANPTSTSSPERPSPQS
jgi:hypothetical protein